MPDIFLSYSRDDQATARRFAEAFEREGLTVWWDQTLRSGENYDQVTESALRSAKAVVVLWSKHSVDSRWVRAEATQADRNDTLVPVMIEPCNRPIMFELKHTAELAHWKGDAGDKAWVAFVGDVRQFVKKETAGVPSPVDVQPVAGRPGNVNPIAITVAIAALVIAGVWWAVSRAPGSGEEQDSSVEVTAPVASREVTLAVLPFANLSSDPEQEYFSDGLTEEILNQLAQVKGLLVTGRTSSFSFKGKNEDLRVIAEKLGVANLLEGSIRKDGEQLRITAQLIDGKTGGHLWSNTYDREKSGVFEMQEEIAKDVAKALSVKLEVGELSGRPGMTRNIEAFDAYLAAAAFNETTPESIRASMNLLERATTLDPEFVIAWVGLADRYAFASANRLPGNTPEGWAGKADAVFERIRGISEFGQMMYETLAGDRSQNAWALVDAQKHFENARALGQKLGLERNFDVDRVFVVVTGRFRESITMQESHKTRDPLDPFTAFLLSMAYAATGNLPAAIAEEDRGLKLDGFQIPLRGSAVMTALATRDRKLIAQRLALMDALTDPSGLNSAMQARLNDPPAALAELRRRAATETNQVALSAIAVWMAWFGDARGALDIYRGHADLFRSSRRGAMHFNIWNPVMRDMRRLPGFKDLAHEMGLVDYWRTYGWGDLCKPVGTDDFECT